jgi:hypothetical protein
MAKLIIDEATMQMLAQKLSSYPIYLGPGGALLEPGIVDLVEGDEPGTRWQPADDQTKLIVLGAEACSEIVFSGERFDDPAVRKRTLKNLTIPVCNLMDSISAVLSAFDDAESRWIRQSWPLADQNIYVEARRRLRKVHRNGPVRKVRHTLGAHLDPRLFHGEAQLRPNDLLQAMGDVLVLFLLVLSHGSRAFSWIRSIGISEDGTRYVVETMCDYPASVRWVTDKDGNVLELAALFLAADPRHEIRRRLLPAIETYNHLIKVAETRLPTIWIKPTSQVHAEERGLAPS